MYVHKYIYLNSYSCVCLCICPIALIEEWEHKLGAYLIEYDALKFEEVLAKGVRIKTAYLIYVCMYVAHLASKR